MVVCPSRVEFICVHYIAVVVAFSATPRPRLFSLEHTGKVFVVKMLRFQCGLYTCILR